MGLTRFNYIPGIDSLALITHGCGCSQRITNNVKFEPDSLAEWSEMAQPGAVMLDIGAYTGLYSIVAALKGASVIAVEPMPANVTRIRLNAEINNVAFPVMQLAASDFDGESWLHYNLTSRLTSGASLEPRQKLRMKSRVQTRRLDGLDLVSLRAIKLDVEMHELSVLMGCVGLVRKFHPSLIVEVLDDKLIDGIRDLFPSYSVIRRLDGRNVLMESSDGSN